MASTYGEDVSVFYQGDQDIDPTGELISGPRRVLEACAKRLMTVQGTMFWDPDYGYDLLGRVGARVSSVGIERIRSGIREQLLLEEAVQAVPTIEFATVATGQYRVTIGVTLAEGPFALVLSVNTLTSKIVSTGSV